jgi:hypothetical protein
VPLFDVPLLPNFVRLSQPRAKLPIHISGCRKPERVNMVTPRDSLHLAKTRVLEPTCQHDMTVQPIRARCDLRERHADLQSNARLLWKDAHGSQSANRPDDMIEQRSNFRPLAAEVMPEIMSPAGVRLVSVREVPPAFFTLP